jgi:hypothetical protein
MEAFMSDPIISKVTRDQPDFSINKQMAEGSWTRKTGADATGAFRQHTFIAKNTKVNPLESTQYKYDFKIRNQDELTEVLALKAFRHTIKSLSAKNAEFIEERINKHKEAPVIKMLKDKEGNIIGAVPVFPPNKFSQGAQYCFTRDGKMFLLLDFWRKPITDQKDINETLHEYFKSGDIGYDVKATHRGDAKKALGILPGFNETRTDRAQAIVSQLKLKDQDTYEAKRVDAAEDMPPPPNVEHEDIEDEDKKRLEEEEERRRRTMSGVVTDEPPVTVGTIQGQQREDEYSDEEDEYGDDFEVRTPGLEHRVYIDPTLVGGELEVHPATEEQKKLLERRALDDAGTADLAFSRWYS